VQYTAETIRFHQSAPPGEYEYEALGDLDTNIRHDLHTTLTRSPRPPAGIPGGYYNAGYVQLRITGAGSKSETNTSGTRLRWRALLGKNRSSTPRSIIKGACTARLS